MLITNAMLMYNCQLLSLTYRH